MIPIFIFSLPRSGSTLLQKMISTSREVSTASEPWILLPFIYTLKKHGSISNYNHQLMVNAIGDFFNGFPNQKDDYLIELKRFILRLYRKRSEIDCRYFLDKTPRYHLISNDIMELFPEGKFIFLWRNPLAVVASIVNSWVNGKWKLLHHKIDLFNGLTKLVATYERHKNSIHSLQYEKLLRNPGVELKKICDYLKIEYNENMIKSFSNFTLSGRMGDKSGVVKYRQIDQTPINAWINTYNNFYRRLWAKRYLSWIGEYRLSLMGYSRQELLNNLDSSINLGIISSIFDLLMIGYHEVNNKLTILSRCRNSDMLPIINT